MKAKHSNFKVLVFIACLLAILLGILLVDLFMQKQGSTVVFWPHFSLDEILQLIRDSGAWGVLVSLGLMIIHSFIPFPSEFVAIANGMIYGPFWGVIITWSGAMMGACIAFFLAKKLGKPFIARLLNPYQLSKISDWTQHYGTGTLLFSRFIPIIAFNLINYAAGLADVKWRTFLWTTGFGILPLTIIMVVVGDQIHTISLALWVLLLFIGLLSWYLIHLWTHQK